MKKQNNKFAKIKNKCYLCGGNIDELNDNFLKLITYNEGDILEEIWFHLGRDGGCWGKYNQERINTRLGQMSHMGMNILKQMGMEA